MSALTDRDSNIAATSNPQGKQTGMGEENQPQDAQQHRDVLEQKSNGNNECVQVLRINDNGDHALT